MRGLEASSTRRWLPARLAITSHVISRSLISAVPTSRRTTAWWALCAGVVALLTGIGANFAVAPLVVFVTMLPLLSHVRWVGVRRALTEPSAATIVLYFYVVV